MKRLGLIVERRNKGGREQSPRTRNALKRHFGPITKWTPNAPKTYRRQIGWSQKALDHELTNNLRESDDLARPRATWCHSLLDLHEFAIGQESMTLSDIVKYSIITKAVAPDFGF